MRAIALFSFNPLYNYKSNNLHTVDDRATSQPLLHTIEVGTSIEIEESFIINESINQTHRRPRSFERFQPYIESHANQDMQGYIACGLSVFSLIASMGTLDFHWIERHHENHKELFAAQIFNIAILSLRYLKFLFNFFSFYIKYTKKIANWLLLNDAPEHRMTLSNNSERMRQPTNCFWPFFKYWAQIDNNNYYLYNILKAFALIAPSLSFFLHFIEKNHEHHLSMLQLEGLNVFFSMLLTSIDVAKIIVQKHAQSNSLPTISAIPNYYGSTH